MNNKKIDFIKKLTLVLSRNVLFKDIKLCELREAVSHYYGYKNWNVFLAKEKRENNFIDKLSSEHLSKLTHYFSSKFKINKDELFIEMEKINKELSHLGFLKKIDDILKEISDDKIEVGCFIKNNTIIEIKEFFKMKIDENNPQKGQYINIISSYFTLLKYKNNDVPINMTDLKFYFSKRKNVDLVKRANDLVNNPDIPLEIKSPLIETLKSFRLYNIDKDFKKNGLSELYCFMLNSCYRDFILSFY